MSERDTDNVVPIATAMTDEMIGEPTVKQANYHQYAQLLGDFLREQREGLEISQTAMRDHGGPAVSTVQNFEAHKISVKPNARTLDSFDTALRLPAGTSARILKTGRLPHDLPATAPHVGPQLPHTVATGPTEALSPNQVQAMKAQLLAQYLQLEEDVTKIRAAADILAEVVINLTDDDS